MSPVLLALLALVTLVVEPLGVRRQARAAARRRRWLRVVHASGKWSGLARAWGAYLKAASWRADLITTTESAGKLHAVQRALGGKWQACIEGEFIVAVRLTRGRLGPGRLARASTQFSGASAWRDARVHYRWVRVYGHGPVLVAVSHLSSAVQNGRHWSGFDAGVDSWQQAANAIGRVVQRRQRLAPGCVVIFTGDVNTHQGMRVWRRRARAALRMTGMWDRGPAPKRGTHGRRRVIDGIWSTAPIVERSIGPAAGGAFDHKRVRAVIKLPAPRFAA